MSEVLRGYTVGVTAEHRSAEQIALLEGRGAECLHGPTARLRMPWCEDAIGAMIASIIERPPTAFVISTALGVRGLFEVAGAMGRSAELCAALSTTRTFVRGHDAHGAAVAAELAVEWGATTESAAEVKAHLVDNLPEGASLVVLGDGGVDGPGATGWRDNGFDVRLADVYRWEKPKELGPAEALIRAIAERRTDAVTFMSAPAVDHLVQISADLGAQAAVKAAFADQVLPVCVGPVSAARVAEAGFGEAVVPSYARLGPMVQRLTDVLVAQSKTFELAGREVELRGRMLRIDGAEPVRLAVRERSVLLALLERPGVVRSKEQLRDTVWGTRDVGAHVVEVTVGRLRRRLGPAGDGIETVIRRGYRASAM